MHNNNSLDPAHRTPDNRAMAEKFMAWVVHFLTASTAVLGLFTLYAIYHGHYILAFWLMGLTIFIDSFDGSLARRFEVAKWVPKIDGALLDNIADYLNYVITPCFLFLVYEPLLPPIWREMVISLVVLASAYQFTQTDAKTSDNFFKGFPSYWNFVCFYMFIFGFPAWLNALILFLIVILVFVPIKYIYLSRMDYLTPNKHLRMLILFISCLYGAAALALLIQYPYVNPYFVAFTILYNLFYFGASCYRTLVPLQR